MVLQSGKALFAQLCQLCITKWRKVYYKVAQSGLLQSGTSFITKWRSYYKLAQSLLQSGARGHYKAAQLLQSGAVQDCHFSGFELQTMLCILEKCCGLDKQLYIENYNEKCLHILRSTYISTPIHENL